MRFDFFFFSLFLQDKWVELRKEYVGFLCGGSLYIFRMGVFLPPNTSYGEKVHAGGRSHKPWIHFTGGGLFSFNF